MYRVEAELVNSRVSSKRRVGDPRIVRREKWQTVAALQVGHGPALCDGIELVGAVLFACAGIGMLDLECEAVRHQPKERGRGRRLIQVQQRTRLADQRRPEPRAVSSE